MLFFSAGLTLETLLGTVTIDPILSIQETGDDLGNLFPLGHRSALGRLSEHDVPVPDMAASREAEVMGE